MIIIHVVLNNNAVNGCFSNFSGDAERQSIEVGVIVMGLCCVSIVGCALVILQVRAVAITRRRRRRTLRNSATGSCTGTSSLDPLAANAPPSYTTGMGNSVCLYHGYASNPTVTGGQSIRTVWNVCLGTAKCSSQKLK